jgi:hypothetical protein
VTAALAAGVAGCGDASIEAGTAPLTEGTEVSSQRYLADTAAAADAVADFSARLSALTPELVRAELRAAAPDLAAARDRAALLAGRLAAMRLEDRRLERQRDDAAAALTSVVAAMDSLTAAAEQGNVRAAAAASERFRQAVGELRRLPAPS